MGDKSRDGHRKRVRDERLEVGFLKASDRDILECLLFYCYPRRDTYPMADRLITQFGSIDNILSKKPQELISDCGFTENTALLFTLISDLISSTRDNKLKQIKLDNPKTVGKYCVDLLKKEQEEALYMICLNTSMGFIASERVSSGDFTSTIVSFRNLSKIALKYNAKTVILAHNHPSGLLNPSNADIEVTKKIIDIFEKMDLQVCDHIIVNKTEYYSLAENKLL